MRLPSAWRPALAAGRLLLSPFASRQRRATRNLALQRNSLVAALAAGLFLDLAEPGGKTVALGRETLAWGKPVGTLDLKQAKIHNDIGMSTS